MIRSARQEDAAAIARLWEHLVAYHQTLDGDLPQAAAEGGKRYAERLINRLDDTHTQVFVAEEGGKVVGYVLGVIADFVPEMFMPTIGGFLADIYVEDSNRRTGIGRALVETLMDWFRSRSVRYVEWYVASNNTAGRAFWQAVGGRDLMIRMRVNLTNE